MIKHKAVTPKAHIKKLKARLLRVVKDKRSRHKFNIKMNVLKRIHK